MASAIHKQSSKSSLRLNTNIQTKNNTLTSVKQSSHKFKLVQSFRIIFATIYLALIILTIPLSFELGGIDCGLNFTLTILLLHFILTTARVLKYHAVISTFFYYLQHLLLPSLLFIFISTFNNNLNDGSIDGNTNAGIAWKLFLINSTPLFTILEGFCSLLLIQSIGQYSRWLVFKKSETWSIIALLTSGFIITASTYFLFNIYVSPPINLSNIGLISASLIGSILTFTLVVIGYGLFSGRSTTIESSLIFAYIIKCIYEIFPELSQLNYQNFQDLIKFISNVLLSLTIKFITENFPNSFQTLWDFFKLSLINLTFPTIINLVYRIGVFFAATKIIPILQPMNTTTSSNSPSSSSPTLSSTSSPLPTHLSLQPPTSSATTLSASTSSSTSASPILIDSSSLKPSKTMRILYLYSPCIIIVVYTNLMIQYNETLNSDNNNFWNFILNNFFRVNVNDYFNNGFYPWQFWHWVNIFLTLILYTIELFLN
ncbi:hypothetical protein PACTADRAFT_86080 [Pachysolen tannophilus NRRL Y-2460]|uniref:ICE2-domain-containing protein n=1 Tax=Pachysolen tannophilus NRRL Y-2460 TaxID=669874 RepID=A0A1E4TT81_PACTA|nr:hypothetical protein PACTADRAFT_86080 [Pachysolen tannophilus NRRL Y-2460]